MKCLSVFVGFFVGFLVFPKSFPRVNLLPTKILFYFLFTGLLTKATGLHDCERGALLAKGPDSSLGEVHRGSCSEDIHMEEEKVEVKVPEEEEEVEDRETDNEESKMRIEERTDNHSGA